MTALITIIAVLAFILPAALAPQKQKRKGPGNFAMATVQSVLGTVKGKLGNIRGSKWKNKNVLAQMPSGYNDAKTPTQQANRRKFSLLQQVGRIMSSILKVGLQSYESTMTWLNAFTTVNYSAITDNGATASVTWADIKIALGSLLGFSNPTVTPISDVSSNAEVTFSDNSNGTTGLATDTIYGVVFNDDGDLIGTAIAESARAAETVDIPFDQSVNTGDVLHLYLFFASADGSSVSDSIYLTQTVS